MLPRLPRAALLPLLLLAACSGDLPFGPENVAVGPGAMVGNGEPVTSGHFAGGQDVLPAPRAGASVADDTRPPNCDADCEAYCAGAGLQNPVNRGLCRSLWGVGLAPRPIVAQEACRRLFIDLVGRVPTADESEAACGAGGDWGATVERLMGEDAFVALNQRRAADRFLYSNEVVSVQGIYDMDNLVAKLYRGLVPYDQFAEVASAHPVLVRRNADPGDRAESLFRQFLGRPPFESEKADMARLYRTWHSGYYDHAYLNMRLPDAFVRFPCAGDDGQVDDTLRGECTSVLWGYHELSFTPDLRASRDPNLNQLTTWSGLLRPEEWEKLQVPGRILASQRAFWEKAVDDVVEQYLGYNLDAQVPEVREELVQWLFQNNGDIRSVHHAVVTSVAYLQSTAGESSARYRWTYGPLKQMEAEVWLDSMSPAAGQDPGRCDHRISRPQAFLDAKSLSAYRVLQASQWRLDAKGNVDTAYATVARTLGGCPENVAGGRFKVVSILTTATQLDFVNALCNPALEKGEAADAAAPAERLLPAGTAATRVLDAGLAQSIGTLQYRALLGRSPSADELGELQTAGAACAAGTCTAEQFARPLCFALLTSAEHLFY
ncbi:hypothetical protein FGE12_11070 [Aggregicoccus sp. 17bor-14]|uniref:hypothetical protein n=1 Tax=Myxococcaceae TaxID=31 RepID=UPI00129C8024|nr:MULTISPECIES: hypothetical protein [Myxococcaceae]MBF5042930.1 hypothetical protein [Simulacricoccus sp. 17bor-14]MRI88697.1 hypothetical protein [Aggregicoccus sp. 17bor-14]